MLQEGKTAWLLERRQTFSRVILASTLSLALFHAGAATAQQNDGKKQGRDPNVAATSPGSKSAMSEPPGRQATSAQNLPKPDSAKSGTGSKGLESSGKNAEGSASDTDAAEKKAEKSTLPFPVINSDAVSTVPGVQPVSSRFFPSAIDIHGSAAGVLLHARKETKYDLLSPLSIWLEDGALLVSVRNPSEMVLIATKFGDICVTAGGDAMVERTDEDLLRVVNLCTSNEAVYLNMHDKLWTSSPWGHIAKPAEHSSNGGGRKGKQTRTKTYEDVESGAVAIAPGYELIVGGHALTMDDVKPEDSVGRRDFKTFEGGRMVVNEISVDNLTQIHDLIKGLSVHGDRASTVFSDIMKSAGVLKTRQGESGFEKHVPAPKVAPKRKPPAKPPANPAKAPPAAKPSRSTPPPPAPATSKDKTPSAPPASKPSEPPAANTGK